MTGKIYPPDPNPAAVESSVGPVDMEMLLKLLLDEDRLAILGLAAQRAYTIRELTDAIPAKRTPPAKHISQLVAAGLLATVGADSYMLNVAQLQRWKRELFARAKLPTPESSDGQVLATYVKNGKMVQYPAQHTKRIVLLRWLSEHFELGRAYPEREVNEILSGHSEDFATLRRYLVDFGYLAREGGIYQRSQD